MTTQNGDFHTRVLTVGVEGTLDESLRLRVQVGSGSVLVGLFGGEDPEDSPSHTLHEETYHKEVEVGSSPSGRPGQFHVY